MKKSKMKTEETQETQPGSNWFWGYKVEVESPALIMVQQEYNLL
jgi:hypothetical protein